MILVIKHIAIEGPGTIEDYFRGRGFSIKTVELSKRDALPVDLSDVEAVVSMGGPMNVYEENEYPFLKEEDIFLKEIIKEEIPFLGVCLGSQLLAKAAGAKVTKAPKSEIGWFKVSLTVDGKKDPLFKGLNEDFDVFQWHGDTFTIPANGKHLAEAADCRNQAFRVGRCAYGLQFHIEVTQGIIEDWIKQNNYLVKGARNMLDEYPKIEKKFCRNANTIYENFLKIMTARKIAV